MGGDEYVMRMRGHRPLRKVSQIRVNPIEMDMEQLNHALNKKMVEKMGRKVIFGFFETLMSRFL